MPLRTDGVAQETEALGADGKVAAKRPWERMGGFYWVMGHSFPVVAEYCGGHWLFSGAEEWRSDDGSVAVLSERLIPPAMRKEAAP